jgi:hypothetical protein
MYGRGSHDQTPFSPTRARACTGLPLSQSYQSVSALLSPRGSSGSGYTGFANGTVVSPANARAGILTEPRNYAPRTSGLPLSVTSDPPPKFDLGIAAGVKNEDHQTTACAPALEAYSLFGPDCHAGTTALVPVTAFYCPSPPEPVQALRSGHLNRLTSAGTRLPDLQMAMDPENFPFLEGARQAVAANYGVVKLKNVSPHLPGCEDLFHFWFDQDCRFPSLRKDRK